MLSAAPPNIAFQESGMGNIIPKSGPGLVGRRALFHMQFIPKTWRLATYPINKQYVGYLILGDLSISRDELTGEIYYIEATQEARGMAIFFNALVVDAIMWNIPSIRVTFKSCSDLMKKKIYENAPGQGFSIRSEPRDHLGSNQDSNAESTGEDITVERTKKNGR